MNYDTKFKRKLIDKLTEKGLSQSSINLYLRNLEKLNGDQPLKSLSFLTNVETILDKLDGYKENTKRLYLISICSVLNVEGKAKLYDKYFKLMINKNKELKAKESNNEKSQQQSENWIEWDKIIEKHKELYDKVLEFINNKKLNEKQYNELLKLVVLSLYTIIPPRRNSDYQNMHIIKNNIVDDKTKNYLVYNDKIFIFNQYKTQKKFGTQEEDIPENLMTIINYYLKFHPKINGKINNKTNEPFLVYYDGKPFSLVNSITRILNSIFDKNLGSSLIRHIYLSNKYQDVVEEQKKDAKAMAHSVSMQQDYVKK